MSSTPKSSYTTPHRRPKSSTTTTSSSTADDARSINQSLRRTQHLLHHELERVSHVTEAMDQDSKLLGDTKGHHESMKDTVRGARGALTALERQKQKERRIFLASVLFFYAVATYVLWTRIRIPFLLW